MKKIFSNKDIINAINLIYENFQTKEDIFLPLKVNYALQCNYKTLSSRGELFDKMKEAISKKYGINGSIPEENIPKAQEEFDEYLAVEQSLDIMMISLDDLGECKLTTQQMQALLFMID